MTDLVDAQVITRSVSSPERKRLPLDDILRYHQWSLSLDSPAPLADTTTPSSPLPTVRDPCFSGSFVTDTRLRPLAAPDDAWNDADEWTLRNVTSQYVAFTRATTASSTTVSSIRSLLQRRQRDERLKRLSPDQRQLYDDIQALRDHVASGQFNVVQAIRDLRKGD